MKKPHPYNTHIVGQQAEEIACAYLQKQGLRLLQKNYRCFVGEIDLIFQDHDTLVFVEVRSRRRADFGTALESITASKQKKLIKSAIHFLQLKKWLYKINSRFDVIVIQGALADATENEQIEWIKHAFEV